LIDYYRARGILAEINGSARIDEVAARLMDALNK
jgi:adenylate kinase family enzyme